MDRFVTQPYRLWDAPSAFQVRQHPAPLVLLPSERELAEHQIAIGQIPVRGRVVGTDGNGAAVIVHRLAMTMQIAQGIAAIVEGLRVVGLERDGALEAR